MALYILFCEVNRGKINNINLFYDRWLLRPRLGRGEEDTHVCSESTPT